MMTRLLPVFKNGDVASRLVYRKDISGCQEKAARKASHNAWGTCIVGVISTYNKFNFASALWTTLSQLSGDCRTVHLQN